MANYNKVILVGRLTRDPESRAFANGGKVTKFGFAASATRRKNATTGQWEDEPMFIDCEVYNRGEYGKLADLIADKCRKGSQILIEGKLHLDQWEDKNGGGKRSKHKIVVEVVQLLDGRPQEGSGSASYGGGNRSGGGFSSGGDAGGQDSYDAGSDQGGNAGGSGGDDIPF
jgi:single-strand DNA-binding protein